MTHLEMQKKYEELRTEMQARTDGLHRMLADATREREELRDANTRLKEERDIALAGKVADYCGKLGDADALRAENTRLICGIRQAVTRFIIDAENGSERRCHACGCIVAGPPSKGGHSPLCGVRPLLATLRDALAASDKRAIRQPEPRP